MRRLVRPSLSFVVAAAVAAVACGKSNSSSSPLAPSQAAPSSTAPAPAPTSGGTVLSGVVVLGSVQPAALPSSFALGTMSAGAGRITISVIGTSINSVTNDDGSFVLQGVPPGDLTLSITGNGILAQVVVAGVESNAQVRVIVRVRGNIAELDEEEHVSGSKVEVEGQIVSVNGNTIVVGQRAIAVVVPVETPIRHGNTPKLFSALVPGVRVHVRATRSGDTLTANEVKLQNSNQVPGGRGAADDDDEEDADEDDAAERDRSPGSGSKDGGKPDDAKGGGSKGGKK